MSYADRALSISKGLLPHLRERKNSMAPSGATKRHFSLREIRMNADIGLREMARKLNLSAPYLLDIEMDRRRCPGKVMRAYMRLAAGMPMIVENE